MRITAIRFLEGSDSRVLARVSITIDDMIVIQGMAVLPGRDGGYSLSFPRHVHKDGSTRDTVHPINKETRAYVEGVVFEAYREALTNGGIERRKPQA